MVFIMNVLIFKIGEADKKFLTRGFLSFYCLLINYLIKSTLSKVKNSGIGGD